MNRPIFVKLDKEAGVVTTTFDLKSAKPIYSIDEVDGLLYLHKGKLSNVINYRLKGELLGGELGGYGLSTQRKPPTRNSSPASVRYNPK